MNHQNKIIAIARIFHLYEDFSGNLNTACQRKCSACCTRNVTLTTLEAFWLAEQVDLTGSGFVEKLRKSEVLPRFLPKVTINQLAEICMNGQYPPDEEADPAWSPCPLLADQECPVYAFRPFGCRCMVSAQNCRETGWADMDPFTLTVNNVVLQYIEQIDADGYTGNLSDLLVFMASEDHRQMYRKGQLSPLPPNLIPNRRMKALMVPPEHQQRIQPILQAIHRICHL